MHLVLVRYQRPCYKSAHMAEPRCGPTHASPKAIYRSMQPLQVARGTIDLPRGVPPAPDAMHAPDGRRQRSRVSRTAGCEQLASATVKSLRKASCRDRQHTCANRSRKPLGAMWAIGSGTDARMATHKPRGRLEAAAAIATKAKSSLRRPKCTCERCQTLTHADAAAAEGGKRRRTIGHVAASAVFHATALAGGLSAWGQQTRQLVAEPDKHSYTRYKL